MKNIFPIALAALLMCLNSNSNAAASLNYSSYLIGLPIIGLQFDSDERNAEKDYNLGMGKNLEVNMMSGSSIKITGWDKEKLSIKILVDGKEDPNSVLNIEEVSGGIKITNKFDESGHDNHNGDCKLEIQVPEKCNLDLQTLGGDINLEKIEGELKGETKGGDLTLSNLKGKLSLSTMGGDIKLTNSSVDGSVTTMGGDVSIENVSGDIKGKSMGGDVSYKNIVNKNGVSTGEGIDISTMGGELNIDNAPAGAKLHTMGGDITVGNAKKFVKATTMGGDIKIDEIDGWTEATTMGGDVSVKLIDELKNENHDVKLKSMGGDITLVVPENFSMNVDITLTYTRNNKTNYDIISDFDLSKEKTKKWDETKGSDRKYIYGKANLNGAKNKVVIETVNGNIYLKKAK
ncbi:MAG: DUF4097 family beta strand repeat-containing protein [Ignavibacteriales bacterium]|nr:DUF4097 family beta strand repeat-containing protein [Ignavibacteriales bacterium]